MPVIDNMSVEAVDSAYFNRLRDIPIDVLGGVRPNIDEEAKHRFLNNQQDTPGFSFGHIDMPALTIKEHTLRQLLSEVQTDHVFPDPAKTLYVAVLEERLRLLTLLQAAGAMNSSADDSVRAEYAAVFMAATTSVYGMPNKNIYAGVLGKVAKKIVLKAADSSQLAQVKQKLQMFLDSSKIPAIDTPVLPGRQMARGVVITDAKELQRIFEGELIAQGLSEWSVEVDETRHLGSVTVMTRSKRVMIPSTEQIALRPKSRELTPAKVRGLVVHEIGTHALRAENGEQSRLLLLSLGLAGYIEGEEGLATYREKQLSGGSGHAGFDSYFAAGLAAGLDQNVGRTFREVFDLLLLYFQVSNKCSEQDALEQAWQRCVRTFRGTSGTIPGVFFTRDIVYRQGSLKIHDFMESPQSKELDLDVGKYDPTNEEHVACLSELGIL